MDILRTENLCKTFGTNHVIQDLNLAVPEHSIFGFIGKNGAGKTTTMRMILGLLKPTSGAAYVCGQKVAYGQTPTNRFVGYLPDVPAFYGYMKPMEYLALCGQITGMGKAATRQKGEELLKLVGLDNANRRIGGFSRGMKQRLGIAQALLNEPRLLICDEPTSALDPIGRREILDILLQVKGQTTVLFSTHILSDVERICDHIAVLHNGSLALAGTPSEVKGRHKLDAISIDFLAIEELQVFVAAVCEQHDWTHEAEGTLLRIHAQDIDQAGHEIIQTLARLRIAPRKLELVEPTLENLFIEVAQ